MEALYSILGGMVVFALVAFFVARKYKDAVLSKLAPLDGEKIRYEEDGITVEHLGGMRPVVYLNSFLRITNRRVILAQRVLFGDKRVLRFVIEHAVSQESGTSVGEAVKAGYFVGKIPAAEFVKTTGSGGKRMIEFPLAGSSMVAGHRVQIHSKETSRALAAIHSTGSPDR